ncbi:kinase-like protein [Daldinia caldariorum]|uniref:kinase-like protein n=1 Tax=Daldinia caldariorum TaxID=326644 RepID=UPI00200854DC|nr:kinase-like protein [Daldinia caldariorum]KAI1468743.1 kinase-like protein [Daldinia caldariorum]
MNTQSHQNEDIQGEETVVVNPQEIAEFVSLSIILYGIHYKPNNHFQINQRESERSPLGESALNLPGDLAINIQPPSEAGNSQDAKSNASGHGTSKPSTVYDRGNSERLRDNRREAYLQYQAIPESSDRALAGTGSWSDTNEPGMAKRLRDAMIDSADGKKFLPLDKLEMIVTEEAVRKELARNPERISPQLICKRQEIIDNDRTQYTSYQKIFAILVLISQVHLISDFLDEEIRDWDLPLESRCPEEDTFLVSQRRTENPRPGYRLQTRYKWSASRIAFFESQQWIVCSPFFSRAEHLGEKVHLYQLSAHDVLPFIKPGTDDRGNPAFLNHGFFSTVRRVKIHPAHHNFPVHKDNSGADFAVKEITRIWDINDEQGDPRDYKRSFDQEVSALKRFCQRNERYIVKLLATYEINGRYHLLFPAADGNLMNHWEEHPEPERIPALWFAEESLGIAQALLKIHRYTYTPPSGTVGTFLSPQQIQDHGIHGDIKPQNILWYKRLPGHLTEGTSPIVDSSGLGYLQISDFGTVKFHRYMSTKNNEILVRGNTYRAPESDLAGNQGSPAIDIWAFGCLYLDLITWYVRGGKSVCEDFPRAREADEPKQSIEGFSGEDKFYIAKRELFTGRQFHIVKPRVSEWIMRLRRAPRCSQFIHDFLDFIEIQMLVISPEKRCRCSMIVRKLHQLQQKCIADEEYHSLGKPHTWVNLRSNLTLLKAKSRQLAQFIDCHGQIVSLILVTIILIIMFLVWIYGEGSMKDLDNRPDLQL